METFNQIAYDAAPVAALAGALGLTYRSYTPTTDQNLLIGSLTLIVIHLYVNFDLAGTSMARLLSGDMVNLPIIGRVGTVRQVSSVVLLLVLALQVAYIERTRALPVAWRQKKD